MPRPRKPPPKRRQRGSGSVGTRKDGRVFCTLPPDLDAKRLPIYSVPGTRHAWASEAEAATWLAAEINARRNPPPDAAHRNEELGAYLTRWLRVYGAGMAPRTFAAYRGALKLWLPYLGHVRIGDLTTERVQTALSALGKTRWQRHKRDGTPTGPAYPYSPRMLGYARTVLGYALGSAVPDVLPTNPVKRTRQAREQPPEGRVWDAVEADRFLAAVEERAPQFALMYRLILRRGLRRGEVVNLRRAAIDRRRGIITIEETAGQRAGESGPTKGRRRREIPLGAELMALLEDHLRRQSRITPWVFANPATGKPYAGPILSRAVPSIARSADLEPITPKDMRATCATILLDEGVPLVRVSRLLGHQNVATTAAHYERLLRSREERVQRIGAEFDAAHERAARAGLVDEL